MSRYAFPRPILDVGVGDGHFASVLFPDGVDAGVDPSPACIREAEDRGVYGDLRVASACDMPFKDETFASVISNSVLEHISDLDGALKEISRVVRPGGLVAITVPGPAFERFLLGSTVFRSIGMASLGGAYGRWFSRISYLHHLLGPEEWRNKLAAAGLTVEEWEYYFSASAHRAFDLSHYVSAPSLLVRKLTGRWLLFPHKPGLGLIRSLLRRFYEQDAVGEGAYILMWCRKKSPSPLVGDTGRAVD